MLENFIIVFSILIVLIVFLIIFVINLTMKLQQLTSDVLNIIGILDDLQLIKLKNVQIKDPNNRHSRKI